MDDLRDRLLVELNNRIAFDNRYAWKHLHFANIFNWAAVLMSFGAAIVAARGTMPWWVTAALASGPGIIIVIFQRFSFYSRSRWHCMVETKLKALAHALEYEGADPAEVSKRFSAVMLEMEPQYPGHGLDGLDSKAKEAKLRKP